MSKEKKKPSAAIPWLDKISDLFGDVDMSLDQVKKSILDDLSELRGKTGESLAANIYLSAEDGFKKDLEELGISGEKQQDYLEEFKKAWQKQEMGKKSQEILNSTEKGAMDAFLSEVKNAKPENLSKLSDIIDSAEPQAKWMSMLSGIPGIGKYIEQLAPFLSSIGLGFLVKKKTGEKADKKTDKKKEKGEKPEEGKEAKEVKGKPKSTLFMGDSNTSGIKKAGEGIFKIDGTIKSVAKGSEHAKWGKEQAIAMSKKEPQPKPLKDFQNAVILFGTNDLTMFTPEKIIENLKAIYETLKKAGVKRIYAATIPPVGGSNYKGSKPFNTRRKVNDWIRKSKGAGLSYRVIDLAKKKSEGGLASDKDPEKLAGAGDGIHFSKKELAKIYQRELELGSGKNV